MKNLIRKYILSGICLMFSTLVFSQGWVESPLTSNGALIQKRNEMKAMAVPFTLGSVSDTIPLDSIYGFFDDFAYDGPYPDTAKWLDNKVYINRDLPISPPTLGVATFDGLNEFGYPYDFSAGMYTTGRADSLTSKPIDLYLPGDTSVYFSFFYQAQGRGNFPDPADSLVLEFKEPISGNWHHVWAKKGLSSPTTDSTWTPVIIHITDSIFLQKGFQFRFTNWATLSGNGDHWHIDYVYLKPNRNPADTVFQDLTFIYNTPSLIKTYSAMPWRQYDTTFMKTGYNEVMANTYTSVNIGSFKYNIYDAAGTQVDTTYTCGSDNFPPISAGYMANPIFAQPPVNYVIPALTGPTNYTIESVIFNASGNFTHQNDTVRHVQDFHNYFAYDDGTAEISFGLSGFLHAQIAEKFVMNVTDTLRAVDIYYNPQWTDASTFTFTLRVWGANGAGGPGVLLYLNPTLDTPSYNQDGRNQFTRFYLDQPLRISGGTTFFVGFDQNTTQPINIGVDVNTNSQNYIYYNTSGSWIHPPDKGSVMMHPVVGTAAEMVGVAENAIAKTEFTIYPNPANDKLTIRTNASGRSEKTGYTIFDIFGRTISSEPLSTETIDVSGLSNGVYFIRLVSGATVSTQKFIISR